MRRCPVADILLEVRDLTKEFAVGRKRVRALNGVSLGLEEGEILAVVGESGSGKTTLANLVLGIEMPTYGDILYRGTPLKTPRPLHMRRRLQYVQQNPWTTLNPRRTVFQSVALPLAVHKLTPPRLWRERVAELLHLVGLGPEFLDRYPHALSGGQRQRVAIARALAAQPEMVILDEPTSALDVSVQARVLGLLLEIQARFSLSYLFISHDLAVVRNFARRILVLYRGQVMETGPTEVVFRNPVHPYTRLLLASVPVVSEEEAALRPSWPWDAQDRLGPGEGCPFSSRCPWAQELCWRERPSLVPIQKSHLVACHFAELFVEEVSHHG
ncbi:oligopeptide/dipeptide ABC transporter, ATPase subunit (plasmid) [Thermus thermophilus SG0.5JP17-16]|uniref:Oligopeptide/dipeptide ABC transporter, ATPase subunit n=1 Tax=Thermus thermophilus (strain SG0.5JP17-16) TaxID=762633 RepID=F6DIN9_THETG|nr:oligopeptide/dipeptide ABC transporter, ATPase subunit [Thermus thermophilus SG0.5JP17-16]